MRLTLSRLSQFFDSFIKNDRVYIVPSAQGLYFLFFLFITFILSMIYGHSLAYAMTFMIFSLTIIVAIISNENLKKIHLSTAQKEYIVNANEWESMELNFHKKSQRAKYFELELKQTIKLSVELQKTGFYLNFRPSQNYECRFRCLKRGVFRIQKVKLVSTYPFDLFYCWSWREVDWVFYSGPQIFKKDNLVYSSDSSNAMDNDLKVILTKKSLIMRDEFETHRKMNEAELQSADIDWKVYAKKNLLYLKEYGENQTDSIVIIDYLALKGGLEDRLEQMMSLMSDCNEKGVPYQLNFPGQTLGPSQGMTFFRDNIKYMASVDDDNI